MGIMDLFKKKTSGNVAKDRLKLVLVSDRANCSSEMMEMMKNDIIEVISRYMDIDAEALDVKITETESDSNNGTVPALVANIPIRDMKHRPGRDRNYRVHENARQVPTCRAFLQQGFI